MAAGRRGWDSQVKKDANFFSFVGGVACPPAEQVANSGGLPSLYDVLVE